MQEPLKALATHLDATNNLLIVSVPNENRRPDTDHLWKFTVSDFKDYGKCITDHKQKNILLLDNKTKQDIDFTTLRNRTGIMSQLGMA